MNALNLNYHFFNSFEPAIQFLKKTNMVKLVYVYELWKEDFEKAIENQLDNYGRKIECLYSDSATFVTIAPICFTKHRDPNAPCHYKSIEKRKLAFVKEPLENLFSKSYSKWKVTKAKKYKPVCIFSGEETNLVMVVAGRAIPVKPNQVYLGIPVEQYFSSLSGSFMILI